MLAHGVGSQGCTVAERMLGTIYPSFCSPAEGGKNAHMSIQLVGELEPGFWKRPALPQAQTHLSSSLAQPHCPKLDSTGEKEVEALCVSLPWGAFALGVTQSRSPRDRLQQVLLSGLPPPSV